MEAVFVFSFHIQIIPGLNMIFIYSNLCTWGMKLLDWTGYNHQESLNIVEGKKTFKYIKNSIKKQDTEPV